LKSTPHYNKTIGFKNKKHSVYYICEKFTRHSCSSDNQNLNHEIHHPN
jgi:hypothetical protein